MSRTTSRLAYKEINEDGTVVSQSDYIYSIVASLPKENKDFGITLKEIARQTGFEINAVSGRVNELKNNGSVKECSKRRCRITGRLVTPVALA
jgi:predicted transcriptional regulator